MSDNGDNGHDAKKVGSVLVVGGGIAGMQASLDCANAGFKVYLLEKQPAIGGNMSRLDKTFPTNDCAMCMLSPKLVETGRHLNIDILAYSDLEKIEGEPGDFTVTVNRRARFIDEDKCNGCGECEAACPVKITDLFNGELSDRKAIYRLYPQAIPNIFTIQKDACPPPCRGTCPAGVNAQGYTQLIAKGEFLKALDVVRERMPLAGICGRVCHHPCEEACNRAKIDEPVSVRNLKRFVSDYEWDRIRRGESVQRPPSEEVTPEKENYTDKIAVIGGGPAGLTCAQDLAKFGYQPTIFEASDRLGGMMRWGIPEYRLPRDLLDHEIDLMTADGVEVRTGRALGRDFSIDQLKAEGYGSVFVATGAQLAKRIPLTGSEAWGVLYGMDFLREVNEGKRPGLGRRVIVIGGGNVAMDVARTALRIVGEGSEVALYCLESRAEMPAHEWEIAEAIEEGVAIHPSWGPERVVSREGRFTGIDLKRCTSVFDGEGRFAPTFDEAQRIVAEGDTVILAIGQACDLTGVEGAIETRRGFVFVDRLTLQTNIDGVFAGGDNVLGPASVVAAVEQGHRAAESIHRYLRGMEMAGDREPVERPKELADIPLWADMSLKPRRSMSQSTPDLRKRDFSEIDQGWDEATAMAEAGRCLNCGGCSECKECVRICKAHAIDHQMRDTRVTLNVGAVVLTNGFDLFDARRKSEYGFGRYPNVVTSMQFERILSASGPYEGHVKRPGDGKTPRKVAWIQCVGSRDAALGNDYCSSVCCMYATKEAIIAREHDANIEPTIFYIDMRAFGKGFESFYNRARNEMGVRFVRSQVSSIKENPENRNLILRYVDEDGGRIREEEFDLVVLSIGLVANAGNRELAGKCGIDLNQWGFAQNRPDNGVASNKKGIILCGAVTGPKDIPETVMESSAAAAAVGELLGSVRGTEVKIKEYPTEKTIQGERPRIGVFICHCGANIASTVDVVEVAKYVEHLPDVVYAEHTIYTCSQDTQERIKQLIHEMDLNRIIVASCTPRTHEPLFQETMREAGLNKYMFEMADIREQCSWVHRGEPDRATQKAKDLVRGSIGKSHLLEPLQFKKVGVTKEALIIGGGIAGMNAALSLARQGFRAHLVEREARLGGQLVHLRHSLEGFDWQVKLRETIREVQAHPAIDVYLNTEIDEVSGFVGNFKTRLKGSVTREIAHGAIVIATGAREYEPEGFCFGRSDRVLTQRRLEAMLGEGPLDARSVVMIQCVGSRDAERPYCSRVCCGEAVKNAIEIKETRPETEVTILYRDIRTYQYKEIYYRKARELGVRFIRFADDNPPQVDANGSATVSVRDELLHETLTLQADLVVLSAATVPDRVINERLSELLKISLNEDGFFMEAHVKLRPVDFANEGIFVCGLAHSPKYTEENITQALAAAGRAATILSRDWLEVGGVVSVIDEDKCATCLTCVRECIYNAPFVNARGRAEIEAAKCQGCGNCAAACPAKAIQLQTFTDAQEGALFRSILKEESPEFEAAVK